MFQIGLTLLVVAWICLHLLQIEPDRTAWGWRDAVVTVPLGIGALLIVCSVIVFLWEVMP